MKTMLDDRIWDDRFVDDRILAPSSHVLYTWSLTNVKKLELEYLARPNKKLSIWPPSRMLTHRGAFTTMS